MSLNYLYSLYNDFQKFATIYIYIHIELCNFTLVSLHKNFVSVMQIAHYTLTFSVLCFAREKRRHAGMSLGRNGEHGHFEIVHPIMLHINHVTYTVFNGGMPLMKKTFSTKKQLTLT